MDDDDLPFVQDGLRCAKAAFGESFESFQRVGVLCNKLQDVLDAAADESEITMMEAVAALSAMLSIRTWEVYKNSDDETFKSYSDFSTLLGVGLAVTMTDEVRQWAVEGGAAEMGVCH